MNPECLLSLGIFAQTDKSDYSIIFTRLNSTTLARLAGGQPLALFPA
jgi:hypothetical protein